MDPFGRRVRCSAPCQSVRSVQRVASNLKLHQPVRRLRKDSECWKLSSHHGNFITAVEPGTHVAVFVDLVRKIFASRHLESLARKKFRRPREQANAIHPMPLSFGHQSFHQPAPPTLTLRPRSHSDRPNLSEMRAIKVQSSTSNDAAFVFETHEVSYVFANLRQRARQQSAVTRIRGDQ